MKKLVLFCVMSFNLTVLSFNCNAQNIDLDKFPVNDKGIIEFSEIVENNLSKDKMYSNVQEWIAKTFGDYKKVIQFEDKENGKLIIKGVSRVNYVHQSGISSTKENINYIITIECKDNKYRYKIEDITIEEISTFIGMTGKPQYFSPLAHIERYDKEVSDAKLIKQDLDNQRSICRAEKNIKKQDKCFSLTSDLVIELDILEKKAASQLAFYNEEFETINSLVSSLKSAMAANLDW